MEGCDVWSGGGVCVKRCVLAACRDHPLPLGSVLSAATNKSGGPSAMQQQQQQHVMYPHVMPPYMVAVSTRAAHCRAECMCV